MVCARVGLLGPLTLPVPRTYENPPGLMIIPRVVTLFDPLWWYLPTEWLLFLVSSAEGRIRLTLGQLEHSFLFRKH